MVTYQYMLYSTSKWRWMMGNQFQNVKKAKGLTKSVEIME